ncbi:hypothetical protein GCM10009038_15920 [Salinicola rhizosphaerae]|uniref:Uncharacterized protein n=1 Tax=Salinicola rhizosphaerae TaxID=1443141 RepID=A0ABQ3DYM3_9GAMM|nr:hypothetical protein GCM10009038_15920 [Salinicola rhizosphaerae]
MQMLSGEAKGAKPHDPDEGFDFFEVEHGDLSAVGVSVAARRNAASMSHRGRNPRCERVTEADAGRYTGLIPDAGFAESLHKSSPCRRGVIRP